MTPRTMLISLGSVVSLVIISGIAISATQDKYSLKVPGTEYGTT